MREMHTVCRLQLERLEELVAPNNLFGGPDLGIVDWSFLSPAPPTHTQVQQE